MVSLIAQSVSMDPKDSVIIRLTWIYNVHVLCQQSTAKVMSVKQGIPILDKALRD